jgi:DNA-directed RNA polymerase specialized sigma24 family protein
VGKIGIREGPRPTRYESGSGVMNGGDDVGLPEKLRDGDDDTWKIVLDLIAPRVMMAVERRCGADRRWFSPKEMADSACRTLFRRLRAGDPRTLSLDTWDQLMSWMVRVAYNKYVDILKRNASERNAAANKQALTDQAETDWQKEEAIALATEEVMVLFNSLGDEEERFIFNRKLDGATEVEIAAALTEQTGHAWTGYMVREMWREIRARLNDRFGAEMSDE